MQSGRHPARQDRLLHLSRGIQCRCQRRMPARSVFCSRPIPSFFIANELLNVTPCVPFAGTPVPQCYDDYDCRSTEQCHQGSCIDACRLKSCGTNALCSARDHAIQCECIPNYFGDPFTSCLPRKSLSILVMSSGVSCTLSCLSSLAAPLEIEPLDPICADNSECPVHKACLNQVCRDPCILQDPCAENAFCKVDVHEPVCTCPPGWTGDPRVRCVPPTCKFCAQKLCLHRLHNFPHYE